MFEPFKSSATHLPVLLAAVAQTKGPVLELGSGFYSTPVLHSVLVPAKRTLLTIECNEVDVQDGIDFFEMFKHLEGEYHKVRYEKNWTNLYVISYLRMFLWDVVLVDTAPAESRVDLIKNLKGNAKFIICHDAEEWHDHEYHYSDVIPLFKHCYRYDLGYCKKLDKEPIETIVLSDEPFSMP